MKHWLTEPSPRKACKDGLAEWAGAEGDCGLMKGESSFAPAMMGDVGRDEGFCAVGLSPGGSTGTARSVELRNSPRKRFTV